MNAEKLDKSVESREFEDLIPESKFRYLFDATFDEAEGDDQTPSHETEDGGFVNHKDIRGSTSGMIVDLDRVTDKDGKLAKEVMTVYRGGREGAAIRATLAGPLSIEVGKMTKKLDDAGQETGEWEWQPDDKNPVSEAMAADNLTVDDAVKMLDSDVARVLKEKADVQTRAEETYQKAMERAALGPVVELDDK